MRSTVSMAFIHYCILVLATSAFVFLQTHVVVVAANDWLAQAECQSTGVPETCMQCLNSDNHTGTVENPAGVATIVVGCVNSHADNLVQEMTQLAASNVDKVSAKFLDDCCHLLASAKKELIAAAEKIHKCDFEGADKSMDSAYTYALQCHQEIDEVSDKSKTEILEGVMGEMRVHEQLCQAAIRIIKRCKGLA